jgi:hypothetical protein
MIIFKSPTCLSRLSPRNPSHAIMKKLIDRTIQQSSRSKHHWVFDRDGGFILLQPEDMSLTLTEWHPGKTLSTIPLEGVHVEDGHYVGVTLLNNQASIVWIIPDALWLPSEVRNALEDNLVPSIDNTNP